MLAGLFLIRHGVRRSTPKHLTTTEKCWHLVSLCAYVTISPYSLAVNFYCLPLFPRYRSFLDILSQGCHSWNWKPFDALKTKYHCSLIVQHEPYYNFFKLSKLTHLVTHKISHQVQICFVQFQYSYGSAILLIENHSTVAFMNSTWFFRLDKL